MSDLAWFFLIVLCSGLFGGACSAVVVFFFTRNLVEREQAVIEAEKALRQTARKTAHAANRLAGDIKFDDEVQELLVETDDTVYMPKVDHG